MLRIKMKREEEKDEGVPGLSPTTANDKSFLNACHKWWNDGKGDHTLACREDNLKSPLPQLTVMVGPTLHRHYYNLREGGQVGQECQFPRRSTLGTQAAWRLALWQGTTRQPDCAFTPHHFQHAMSHFSHVTGQEPAKARLHSSLQCIGDTNKTSRFFLQKLDAHSVFLLKHSSHRGLIL